MAGDADRPDHRDAPAAETLNRHPETDFGPVDGRASARNAVKP
ncbi:MAG: hypothetical protein QMD46_09295 [Methanomicrobiales archaeon]|nr:hypothetical protein [Methanomicrobiales archaeon]